MSDRKEVSDRLPIEVVLQHYGWASLAKPLAAEIGPQSETTDANHVACPFTNMPVRGTECKESNSRAS